MAKGKKVFILSPEISRALVLGSLPHFKKLIVLWTDLFSNQNVYSTSWFSCRVLVHVEAGLFCLIPSVIMVTCLWDSWIVIKGIQMLGVVGLNEPHTSEAMLLWAGVHRVYGFVIEQCDHVFMGEVYKWPAYQWSYEPFQFGILHL